MQMNQDTYQIKQIQVSQINIKDVLFKISSHSDSTKLCKSIKFAGLINYPLLLPHGPEYIIVCGFKRIQACIDLGFSSINARVLKPDCSTWDCVVYSVCDNSLERDLDILEQSRALLLLKTHIPSGCSLTESAIKLGLPANSDIIKKTLKLCQMPQIIQKGLLNKTIPLAIALQLDKMDKDDAKSFANFCNRLKMSLSKQREILNLMEEISKRDNIKNLLNTSEIQKHVNNEDLDNNQKVNNIRSWLKQKRFPNYTKADLQYNSLLKKLGFEKSMKFIAPAFFEGNNFSIHLSFSKLDQLKKQIEILYNAIQKPESLKSIINKDFI